MIERQYQTYFDENVAPHLCDPNITYLGCPSQEDLDEKYQRALRPPFLGASRAVGARLRLKPVEPELGTTYCYFPELVRETARRASWYAASRKRLTRSDDETR